MRLFSIHLFYLIVKEVTERRV